MVRTVDPNNEASVWHRKCTGYARQRQNRCKPEEKDRKEHGHIVESISPAGRKGPSEGWKMEGEKRRVKRKECKILRGN